jgi:hypothetical protein
LNFLKHWLATPIQAMAEFIQINSKEKEANVNAEVKLAEYGDSMVQAAAANCSSPAEAKEFVEFLLRNAKLTCAKCSYEFNPFQKSALAGIDKILQFKSSLYAMQYQMAKSLGILSSHDEAQCPKCGSGYGCVSTE